MHYFVYRMIVRPTGQTPQWLATTRYLEDAQRIYKSFSSAYIVDSTGAMIEQKGF